MVLPIEDDFLRFYRLDPQRESAAFLDQLDQDAVV